MAILLFAGLPHGLHCNEGQVNNSLCQCLPKAEGPWPAGTPSDYWLGAGGATGLAADLPINKCVGLPVALHTRKLTETISAIDDRPIFFYFCPYLHNTVVSSASFNIVKNEVFIFEKELALDQSKPSCSPVRGRTRLRGALIKLKFTRCWWRIRASKI